MITQDTVFIIGAGASNPYGYPMGNELVKIICANLNKDNTENFHKNNFNLLLKLGFSEKELTQFREDILHSDTPSIDFFLEYRNEYIELGKIAIAQALIPFEITEKLYSGEKSWLKFLFNKMCDVSFDDFFENKVSFITFNYDRTIEHYLMNTLKAKYSKNGRISSLRLQTKIPIIHLYGQLGFLPWQIHSNFQREYNTNISENILSRSGEKIKIIYEKINEDEEFKKARKLLNDAVQIYFLGFGYHETNLKRLKMDSFIETMKNIYPREVKGTAMGLTLEQKKKIPDKYGIELSNKESHVLEFLQNEIVLH